MKLSRHTSVSFEAHWCAAAQTQFGKPFFRVFSLTLKFRVRLKHSTRGKFPQAHYQVWWAGTSNKEAPLSQENQKKDHIFLSRSTHCERVSLPSKKLHWQRGRWQVPSRGLPPVRHCLKCQPILSLREQPLLPVLDVFSVGWVGL